jgi:hypothetical protein
MELDLTEEETALTVELLALELKILVEVAVVV